MNKGGLTNRINSVTTHKKNITHSKTLQRCLMQKQTILSDYCLEKEKHELFGKIEHWKNNTCQQYQ